MATVGGSRQVSLRHHRKCSLGFMWLLGEAKCFSYLRVVMEIAERKPSWKAPWLGWKRISRADVTEMQMSCSNTPQRTTVWRHRNFIPWQFLLFLSLAYRHNSEWYMDWKDPWMIEIYSLLPGRVSTWKNNWAELYKNEESRVPAHWVVTPAHTPGFCPFSTQEWYVRKALALAAINPQGNPGASRSLSAFRFPHLLNRRSGLIKKSCGRAGQKSRVRSLCGITFKIPLHQPSTGAAIF